MLHECHDLSFPLLTAHILLLLIRAKFSTSAKYKSFYSAESQHYLGCNYSTQDLQVQMIKRCQKLGGLNVQITDVMRI